MSIKYFYNIVTWLTVSENVSRAVQ